MRWSRSLARTENPTSTQSVSCKRCGSIIEAEPGRPRPGIRCPRCGFIFRIHLAFPVEPARTVRSRPLSKHPAEGTSPPPSARVETIDPRPGWVPKTAPVAPREVPKPKADWLALESFRTLRTNLLMRLTDRDRLLLVTSSRPGEGKTTVAANLALSLLSVGKSVLVVDGDLRRPAIHKFLEVESREGLSDVLTGRRSFEEVVCSSRFGPAVLTSGSTTGDPQELFASTALERTLSRLKELFDVVLIDSAPYLAVADTSLLAKRADGVVLVLRWGVVSQTETRITRGRLEAAGCRVMGAVFNCFESTAPDYYHPYSRDYGEHQEPGS